MTSATSTPGKVNFRYEEKVMQNTITSPDEYSDSSIDQERENHMRSAGAIPKNRNMNSSDTERSYNMPSNNARGGRGRGKNRNQGYAMKTRNTQRD